MTPPRLPYLRAPVSAPAGPAPSVPDPALWRLSDVPKAPAVLGLASWPQVRHRPALRIPGRPALPGPGGSRARRSDGPARVGGRLVLTSWLVVLAMSPASVGRLSRSAARFRASSASSSPKLSPSNGRPHPAPAPLFSGPAAPRPRAVLGGTSATLPPPPAPIDRSLRRSAAVLLCPAGAPDPHFRVGAGQAAAAQSLLGAGELDSSQS